MAGTAAAGAGTVVVETAGRIVVVVEAGIAVVVLEIGAVASVAGVADYL